MQQDDKENANPSEPQSSDKPSNYLDIELPEIGGEVPIYEDVSIPQIALTYLVFITLPGCYDPSQVEQTYCR